MLIENRLGYVRSWEEVEFLPQVLQALARMKDCPYKFVIVTNQACIAHGLVSKQTVDEINQLLIAEVEKQGGRIDGVFVCPHKPEDLCFCRKPRPGLLFQAARALSIDLSKSYVIGDKLTDLQAGWAAGVPKAILVQTGYGAQEALLLAIHPLPPVEICQNLDLALEQIATS